MNKQSNDNIDQLSRIINNLPGIVYRCANDKNWTMFYINDACEKITGYKPEDFLFNHKIAFNDIVHPDHRLLLHEGWNESILKNEIFEREYQIITASGETRWVWEHGKGIYDDAGKLIYLEGYIYDISFHKKAKESLAFSERKFKSLFDEMTDMALICRLEKDSQHDIINIRIVEFNQAFYRLMQTVHREVQVGKSLSEIIDLDKIPEYHESLQSVRAGRNFHFIHDFEAVGKQFLVLLTGSADNIFAIIATDITDLIRTNKLLIEKTKELENYVYIVSHDLRSPLVNIQGFSERLKRYTDQIDELLANIQLDDLTQKSMSDLIKQKIPLALNFIYSSVAKMENMLNNLLQISRTGRLTMNIQPVKMDALIANVVNNMNYQLHEINAKVHIDHLPDCFGDELLLNQLFSNIISNAVKYRDQQRNLEISISGISRLGKVLYRIIDNGIGISKEHLDKIWNIFYRIDSKIATGDGVGLSLGKRIIEKHRGKIWVESTERYGTTFFIELPSKQFLETETIV
jgi:PAS domain S-box-containing protein